MRPSTPCCRPSSPASATPVDPREPDGPSRFASADLTRRRFLAARGLRDERDLPPDNLHFH